MWARQGGRKELAARLLASPQSAQERSGVVVRGNADSAFVERLGAGVVGEHAVWAGREARRVTGGQALLRNEGAPEVSVRAQGRRIRKRSHSRIEDALRFTQGSFVGELAGPVELLLPRRRRGKNGLRVTKCGNEKHDERAGYPAHRTGAIGGEGHRHVAPGRPLRSVSALNSTSRTCDDCANDARSSSPSSRVPVSVSPEG